MSIAGMNFALTPEQVILPQGPKPHTASESRNRRNPRNL